MIDTYIGFYKVRKNYYMRMFDKSGNIIDMSYSYKTKKSCMETFMKCLAFHYVKPIRTDYLTEKDIRKCYFDLIFSIYPYAECYEDIDRKMQSNEMLYNLIEMKKDMLKDSDTIEDRNKINALIKLFKCYGITKKY